MIITLDQAKKYLRLDSTYTDEDDLINTLISAAELYCKNITGKTFDNTNQLAVLLCLVLVSDFYENRELKTEKPSEKINLTIQSIILQLQYC